MKLRSYLFVALSSTALVASSQYQLEYTYYGGGTGGAGGLNEFYMVHLEAIGDRYVYYDRPARAVYMMDLYHQLVSTISLAAADPDSTGIGYGEDILYVSQHLFDADDDVELMFVKPYSGTSVINEDGTVIQFWPNELPLIAVNIPQEQRPIYNTPLGTKLILSDQLLGDAKVYSLPGTLFTGISGPHEQSVLSAPVKVYPNPTASEVTVDIQWTTRFTNADMAFFNSVGELVLTQAITVTGQRINIAPLAAGEYSYRVSMDGQQVNAGKLTKL